MQSCGAQSQRIYLEYTLIPNARETLWESGKNDYKSQSIRELVR